jgi:putative NADH-flavin reductase
MKLTIFGATGGTGSCLADQAVAAGHEVTVVVRDPARLAGSVSSRLRVVTADVLDPAAIGPAVAGADTVISAIGPRASGPTTISQDSAASIIAAMRETGVRRLMTVSGSIVADEGDGILLRYLARPVFRATALRHVCADMRRAEAEVSASGLDWTIMRPPRLTDKPAAGSYRTAIDRNPRHGLTISRADLAACMLARLDDPATVGHHVGVAT